MIKILSDESLPFGFNLNFLIVPILFQDLVDIFEGKDGEGSIKYDGGVEDEFEE